VAAQIHGFIEPSPIGTVVLAVAQEIALVQANPGWALELIVPKKKCVLIVNEDIF